jgi:sec-independent protein translocase protein TatA
MLASIAGPDLLIVVAVVLLFFGGSQLPKLARSLGSASHEFKKAHEEGEHHARVAPDAPVVVASTPPVTGDGAASITTPSGANGTVVLDHAGARDTDAGAV